MHSEYSEYSGKNVIIETMRWGFVGTVVQVTPRTLTLRPACRVTEWPAWRDLMNGVLIDEYTLPYADGVTLAIPVLEIATWEHDVPLLANR